MSRCLVIALLAVFSFAAVSCAPASEEKAPAAEAKTFSPPEEAAVRDRDVPRHFLDVTLDIAGHTIAGTDTIKFKAAEESAEVYLAPFLEVSRAMVNGADIEPAREEIDGYEVIVIRSAVSKGEENVFEIEYSGTIYDPPKSSGHLTFVAGDRTNGIIGEEGVFLSGRNWYPFGIDAYFEYEMTVRVGKPFRALMQGELVSETGDGEWNVTEWRGEHPTDYLSLSAADYVVNSKKFGDVTIYTYFFDKHKHMSDLFIEKSAEYIEKFSELLGPYPYKKFAVVENSWSSGFGMPSYTLLVGDYVIARGKVGEGFIGHEIMHNWWGNYVFFSEPSGNWCEGLTTYCSNYLWREIAGDFEGALKHLRGRIVAYNIQVDEGNAYPAREFGSKASPVDDEIGYTRPMFLFHQLRRMFGDELFFAALRRVVTEFGGRGAVWDDFERVFETFSGRSLDGIFSQWLDRTDLPDLKLKASVSGGNEVAYSISQANDSPYFLYMVLRVTGKNGEVFDVPLNNVSVTSGTVKVDFEPVAAELDAGCDVLRKASRTDIAPCLNQTLEDDRLIVVLPSLAAGAERELYKAMTARVEKTHGAAVMVDKDVTDDDFRSSSLLVFGRPFENRLLRDRGVTKLLPEGFGLSSKGFKYKGELKADPLDSWMFSVRNPENGNRSITVFYGNSPDAASAASRLLFFYGWESHFYFMKGRVADRGYFEEQLKPLEVTLNVQD